MRKEAAGEKRFERIWAGPAEGKPAAEALLAMALRLRDHAHGLGFRTIGLLASRVPGSSTRLLRLADPAGREWVVRVAGGALPHRTGHAEPHLDFVCRDGISGFSRAAAALDRIAAGQIEWRRPELRARRRPR